MAKPEDHIIKTTIRVPKVLWDKVRILAIQRGTSAESLVTTALGDAVAAVANTSASIRTVEQTKRGKKSTEKGKKQ